MERGDLVLLSAFSANVLASPINSARVFFKGAKVRPTQDSYVS